MADFRDQSIAPIQTAVTPPKPVADESGVILAQGQAAAAEYMGKGVSNAFSIIGDTYRQWKQSKAATSAGVNLTSFVQKLGKIDAAVQQGMSPTQAATLKRNLLTQTMAADPISSKEYISTFNSLSGKEGFGADTPETAAKKKLAEDAYNMGWYDESSSDTQREEAIGRMKFIEQRKVEIDSAQSELALKQSQMSTESQEYKLAQQKASLRIQGAMIESAPVMFEQTESSVKNIVDRWQANGGVADQNSVLELQAMKNEVSKVLAGSSLGGDETTRQLVKDLAAPINEMIENAIKLTNGEVSKEVFDNRLSVAKSRSTLAMTSRDSRLLGIFAVSEFYPKLGEALANRVAPQLMPALMSEVSGLGMANSQATPAVTQALTSMGRELGQGSLPAEQQNAVREELAQKNKEFVESFGANGGRYLDPKAMAPSIDYLASPSFKDYSTKNEMDPRTKTQAIDTLQRDYVDDLLPNIEKILSNDATAFLGERLVGAAGMEQARASGDVTNRNPGSVRNMVDLKWSTQGAVFTPRDNSPISKIAAERLNAKISPLLNRSVRATSHLEGHDNYQEVFDSVIAPSLGLLEATPNSRIEGAFQDVESAAAKKGDKEVAPKTPAQRIDEAFEATEGLEERTIEVAPQDSQEVIEEAPQGSQEVIEEAPQDGQEVIEEAVPAESPVSEQPKAVSNSDLVRMARDEAVKQGYDPESTAGMAFASRQYRKLLSEKRKFGEQVSKAAVAQVKSPDSKTAMSVPQSEVVNYVKTGMVDRGLPEHIAEAFILNFQDESGMNPGINEKNPIVPGSRGGYGLYQLTGPRRRQYEKFAEATGRSPDSIDAQLDFLMWELENSESKAAEKIFSAETRGEAAEAIVRFFLRPLKKHQNSRAAKYRKAD